MDNVRQFLWPRRISKWIIPSTCESRLSFHCSCGIRHVQVGSTPPHRAHEFKRQPIPLQDLVLEALGKFGCSEKEQWTQITAYRIDSFWSPSPVKAASDKIEKQRCLKPAWRFKENYLQRIVIFPCARKITRINFLLCARKGSGKWSFFLQLV